MPADTTRITASCSEPRRSFNRSEDELAGSVGADLQPAEKGPGGALPMIEAGALEDPAVEASQCCTSIHV